MDAVKFLQERNRMYESGAATPGIGLEDDYDPVIAVKVVEEWSAAHPRKTRQSVFLEQYPNARIDSQGTLCICPASVYGDVVCPKQTENCRMLCYDCRREFWLQEVE